MRWKCNVILDAWEMREKYDMNYEEWIRIFCLKWKSTYISQNVILRCKAYMTLIQTVYYESYLILWYILTFKLTENLFYCTIYQTTILI